MKNAVDTVSRLFTRLGLCKAAATSRNAVEGRETVSTGKSGESYHAAL
jgi:hypothetical protein